MKVTVSRASSRFDEYEAELEIPEILIKQLLNLGREIPVEENSGSWDAMEYHPLAQQKAGRHMEPFIIDINPDTGDVELMIYDFYVE